MVGPATDISWRADQASRVSDSERGSYRVEKLGDHDEGKLLAFLQSMQGREGGYFQADLPRTITVRCIRAVDLPRRGRLHKRP
jgi:hypothetical protein